MTRKTHTHRYTHTERKWRGWGGGGRCSAVLVVKDDGPGSLAVFCSRPFRLHSWLPHQSVRGCKICAPDFRTYPRARWRKFSRSRRQRDSPLEVDMTSVSRETRQRRSQLLMVPSTKRSRSLFFQGRHSKSRSNTRSPCCTPQPPPASASRFCLRALVAKQLRPQQDHGTSSSMQMRSYRAML